MCGSASTRSTTPAAARDRMAVPNAGRRPGSSASKHTVRPPSEVSRVVIGSCSCDRRFELGGPDDPEHRGAHRESGRRAACVLARQEPIGIAAHERLHRGIRRVRALHDRPTVRARPAHRLHPDRQRALARGKPRAAWPRGRHRGPRRGRGRRRRGPARPRARRPRSRPSASAAAGASDASDRHRGARDRPTPPPARLRPVGSRRTTRRTRRSARAPRRPHTAPRRTKREACRRTPRTPPGRRTARQTCATP